MCPGSLVSPVDCLPHSPGLGAGVDVEDDEGVDVEHDEGVDIANGNNEVLVEADGKCDVRDAYGCTK